MFCRHKTISVRNFNLVCLDCGEVLEERNLVSNSVRIYNHEDKNRKKQDSVIIDKKSQWRTTFDYKNADDIPSFHRMWAKNKWCDDRKYTKINETSISINNCLEELGLNNYNLSDTIENVLLKTGNINLQGKSIDIYSAACIVYSIRLNCIPISVKRIFDFYNIKKRMNVFNMLRNMKVKYKLKEEPKLRVIDYVLYYLNKVLDDSTNEVKKRYKRITDRCNEIIELLDGHHFTMCTIAGIVYYISKVYNITIKQGDLTGMVGVSTVSLRKKYNLICDLYE